ncbi:Ig-like domain-containing protein [Pseudomonas sp. LB3P38]|uniref:Ig-like domain-containing protein n=1 Tax=Pseudomonas lyxosi TaxID=3398358 RepID=UPI0039EEA0EC
MTIFALQNSIDNQQVDVLPPLPKPGELRSLSIDRLLIANLITGLPGDEGVEGGINYDMLHDGLDVVIDPWLQMSLGDEWVVRAIYGSTPPITVLTDTVKDTEVNQRIFRTIAANQLKDGVCNLHVGVRRVSNAGGDYEQSPPLTVLIKTTLPGGPDPDIKEPYHQNLAPIQVDQDILINGVTKDYLDEYGGVNVTVPAYDLMRKNSVILVHWGSQTLVMPRVKESQVGKPISFMILRNIIEQEGRAIPLKLNYSIIDVVENRSAAPAPPIHFNVDPTLDLLEAPIVDKADQQNQLDIVALKGEDVLTFISSRKVTFSPGDRVKLNWVGVDSGGHEVPDEQIWEPVQSSRSHDFHIPYSKVQLIARGSAQVAFTLTRAAVITDSRVTFVTVTGLPVLLLPPEVPEAIGGAVPAQTPLAHVIVKKQPGAIIVGDVVRILWHILRDDGSEHEYIGQRRISEDLIDKDIVFDIQPENIATGDGGRLTVSYIVYRDLTRPQPSENLLLYIGDTLSELQAPIVNAAPDGVLIPEEVQKGAEVIIAPYAGMRALDRVKLEFVGATQESSWSISQDLTLVQVGHNLLNRVPFELVAANRYKEVRLVYTVTNQFTGQIRISKELPLKIGELILPEILSVQETATGANISNGGTTLATHVTVTGRVSPFQPVEVFNGSASIGKPPVDDKGQWTIAVPDLAVALHSLTAQVLGGDKPTSPPWTFTVWAKLQIGGNLSINLTDYFQVAGRPPSVIPDEATRLQQASGGSGGYTYVSSNQNVAKVISADGRVGALANGTTTITVSDGSQSASYQLIVTGIRYVRLRQSQVSWHEQSWRHSCLSVAQFQRFWSIYSLSGNVASYLGWPNSTYWTSTNNDCVGNVAWAFTLANGNAFQYNGGQYFLPTIEFG